MSHPGMPCMCLHHSCLCPPSPYASTSPSLSPPSPVCRHHTFSLPPSDGAAARLRPAFQHPSAPSPLCTPPSPQMELLRAYDPRFNIPGRPASETLLPEASALQDSLLAHPRLADFGAEV